MRTPRAAILLVLVPICATLANSVLAEPTSPADSNPPFAIFRNGQLSYAAYTAWLRYRGAEDLQEARLERANEMALVSALADAAISRGLDRDPRLQLEIAEGRFQRLVATLRQDRARRVEISAEEVEAAFRTGPKAFDRPRRVRLRNLYKPFPAGADKDARQALRKEMEALRARLVAGGDFADLARKESRSHTRWGGGAIGLVGPGVLAPEIEEVALGLEAFQISPVIETADGLTLLRCDEVAEEIRLTAEDTKKTWHERLRARQVREDWRAFQEELLKGDAVRWRSGAAATGAASEVALEAAGHTWDAGRIREWLKLRNAEPESLPTEVLNTELRSLALRLLAARRAEQLGLADPEVSAWERRERLALAELAARARERFEPPTEGELRRAYANPRQRGLAEPAAWRLGVIHLIPESEGELLATHRLANRVHAALEAGEMSFADAARRHSAHPSAGQGGEIGWYARARMFGLGPHVYRAIEHLEAGEPSDVLRTKDGLWIFEVRGHRPVRRMHFNEARPKLEEKLAAARIRQLDAKIRSEMAARLEVQLVE